MSVKDLKNYDEWPIWYELAMAMASVAAFKIVQSGIYNCSWNESISAVVNLTRDDLIDYVLKRQAANLKITSNLAGSMHILGGLGVTIDLSNESALVVQTDTLINFLMGKQSVEPLECTSTGKAWARMCTFLKKSESFKALLTFISEWYDIENMKLRISKYGLDTSITSNAYSVIEHSFKEAYPYEFKKGAGCLVPLIVILSVLLSSTAVFAKLVL